jgi:hypothetical protein
MHEMDSKG